MLISIRGDTPAIEEMSSMVSGRCSVPSIMALHLGSMMMFCTGMTDVLVFKQNTSLRSYVYVKKYGSRGKIMTSFIKYLQPVMQALVIMSKMSEVGFLYEVCKEERFGIIR